MWVAAKRTFAARDQVEVTRLDEVLAQAAVVRRLRHVLLDHAHLREFEGPAGVVHEVDDGVLAAHGVRIGVEDELLLAVRVPAEVLQAHDDVVGLGFGLERDVREQAGLELGEGALGAGLVQVGAEQHEVHDSEEVDRVLGLDGLDLDLVLCIGQGENGVHGHS